MSNLSVTQVISSASGAQPYKTLSPFTRLDYCRFALADGPADPPQPFLHKVTSFLGPPKNHHISARGCRRSDLSCGPPRPDHHPAGERLPTECCDEGACRGRGREGCVAKRGGPRHRCAHLIRDGHARQVPSRPPDHQLPIRHGHDLHRPAADRHQQAGRSPTLSHKGQAMGP
jgi:hypothetical protein